MVRAQKLLLVTSSYPDASSSERSFVFPELLELVRAGFEVTLMPVRPVINVDPEIPSGIHVSNELALAYRRVWSLFAIFSLFLKYEFWLELVKRPRLIFRFRFWKDSLRAAISANVFRRKKGKFDLFYTYWFSGETTGMRFSGVAPVVTRAHGYDIYIERRENKGWIPYRPSDLNHIDKVVVLSSRASSYLESIYHFDKTKTIVSPLGVKDQDPAPFDQASLAEEIVFLSCSYPSAVKRLPLIGQLVLEFARVNPQTKVRWVHIGAQFEELQIGLSQKNWPENFSLDAKGSRQNSYVNNFIATNKITFFVNLSEMEGLPVSIMEAMAFGVPIVATDVGCVGDLLEAGGGIIVSPNIAIPKLAGQITDLVADVERYFQMRLNARASQRQKFNAQRNHAQLSVLLKKIAN